MVDSCQQLPQEAAEMVGTELVGSPAPTGSKAAGVDLATAQEAIATFPASVPTVQWQTQCRVSWKSLQRPYVTDGKTEAYRGGRGSVKFTQQVVARPERGLTCPEVCPILWGLGSSLGTVVVSRVRGNKDGGGGTIRARCGMGPAEGREWATTVRHWGAGEEEGGESSSRPFPGFLVLPFLAV